MANPTFSNLTYAGEHYAEVFGPTILNPAGLVDSELCTPIDRSKFKQTINEIDDVIALQNPTAAFSPTGTAADVDEVNLTTVPMEFHKQISLDTVRQAWYSGQLQAGSLNDYQYDALTDRFVRDVYVPKLVLAQDALVLKGKTYNGLPSIAATIGSYTFSASYTGLYGLLNASSAVRKIGVGASGNQVTVASVTKGTTTTLTLAAGSNALSRIFAGNIVSIRLAAGTGWAAINVDAEVLQVVSDTSIIIDVDTDALTSGNYTASSARVRFINRSNILQILMNHLSKVPVAIRNGAMKIAIPSHLAVEWAGANAAATTDAGAYTTSMQLQFFDKAMVYLDSAPANTLGTWEAKRVFYGYDMADDASKVEVLWQGATGNKVYNLRGAMKTAVAISTKFANEMTLTTPES